MTSPADKATDDVRGLVERLTRPRRTNFYGFAEVHPDFLAKTAAALTSLLERAERAEARIKELEQERDEAVEIVQHVSRADLAAGWEIVGLPRMGRHICWVTDHHELVPTLDALVAEGTLIASVIPVAALRRARAVKGAEG